MTVARTVNFRSKEAYRRWLAYAKMHARAGRVPERIKIAGRIHHVNHARRAANGR